MITEVSLRLLYLIFNQLLLIWLTLLPRASSSKDMGLPRAVPISTIDHGRQVRCVARNGRSCHGPGHASSVWRSRMLLVMPEDLWGSESRPEPVLWPAVIGSQA
jgi:hypothetical protein